MGTEVILLQNKWQESLTTTWCKELAVGKPLLEIINDTRSAQGIITPNTLICSDGRCPHLGNEISEAGSGILMDETSLTHLIITSGIGAITSHSQCGAAKIAFAHAKDRLGAKNAEEYAIAWTKQQAQKYNLRYRHIEAKEFNCPVHHERGMLLDATLKLHPFFLSGMPNFFISNSPRFAGREYVGAVVKALTAIGFSDHAFGSYFTAREPFYILIGARDEKERGDLETLAKETLEEYEEKISIASCIL